MPGSGRVEGPGPGRGQMCGTHSLSIRWRIDEMVFVRVAFELAAYRPTAGESVLTVTQRESVPRTQ